MLRKLLIGLAVTTALMPIAGAAWAVSGAGAINLVFPIGARYNAMGEAGVALATDVTAIWWNPGGLAFLMDKERPKQLHIMQSPLAAGLADDINLYWLGYASPWGQGIFGVNLNYLSMGEQIATSEEPDADPLGTFNSHMFSLGVTYGFKLLPNLGIGMGVKYFRDRLAPDYLLQDGVGGSGDSFGVDLGALWVLQSLPLQIGLAITNLGPNITHVDADQSDPMPRKWAAGIAYRPLYTEATSLVLIADYIVPLIKWDNALEDYKLGVEGDEEEWGVGAEWSYLHSLFLRVGYKAAKAGDIEDYTWGFGLNLWRWLGKSFSFDYATVPQAEGLDRVNRFSVSFDF